MLLVAIPGIEPGPQGYEPSELAVTPYRHLVLLIGLEPIRTFAQGILSPSRATNFATEAFRALYR